jgi:hypothetical protein
MLARGWVTLASDQVAGAIGRPGPLGSPNANNVVLDPDRENLR